jgi:C4-type Zn-finger protein
MTISTEIRMFTCPFCKKTTSITVNDLSISSWYKDDETDIHFCTFQCKNCSFLNTIEVSDETFSIVKERYLKNRISSKGIIRG